jgi:hypothetical protein
MKLITLTLLLTAGQSDLTLGSITGRSPREAGDILLRGQDHGRVEKVERVPLNGMYPPGSIEFALVEATVESQGVCSRRRWIASFSNGPDRPDDAASLIDVSPVMEAAIPSGSGCAASRFARLQPGIEPREAVAALTYFDRVLDGRASVSFSCSDKTRSHLCRSRASIMQTLKRGVGYASREGHMIELTLTTENGPLTTIRYSTLRPGRLRIERTYPPPF